MFITNIAKKKVFIYIFYKIAYFFRQKILEKHKLCIDSVVVSKVTRAKRVIGGKDDNAFAMFLLLQASIS